ncbi:hypothetical protein [Hydrogenoanaerobacterium sp.]|uniref:hypothetical protein n=1 Tax=Hydrogenoanaerobacterium sp. TaxID=2953763 RepID=UPI0028990E6D|nr:hypothetical protein [Hydrogenoanaerobacterium sp.]
MADVINDVAHELVNLLRTAFAGEQAAIALQFSSAPHPVPLTKTMLAVGLQDAELLPCALSDFAGLDEDGNSLYGRMLEITAAIQILCPPGKEAAECQRVFGKICNSLLFVQQEYEVTRVWCGKVQFEKELGALVLPCYAKLHLTVCQQRQEQAIGNYVIRRVTE